MKKISFVIPCYRSEKTLPGVVEEINRTMEQISRYEYEIVLVNDCSPDNTFGTIQTGTNASRGSGLPGISDSIRR